MSGLNPKTRTILQIIGGTSLLGAAMLYWHSRVAQAQMQAAARGEEVYASHDCTDCHLPVHTLRQKKEKNEPGLLRTRRGAQEVRQFLASDSRHRSFALMAENDRSDLIAYLRSLVP